MTVKAKKPKELLADQELIGFTRQSSGGHQVLRRASSAKVTFEDHDRDYKTPSNFSVRYNSDGHKIIMRQVAGTNDFFPGRPALVFRMKAGTSAEEAEQLVEQMRKHISEPLLDYKS